MIETSSADLTLIVDATGPCEGDAHHEFLGTLGCAPHVYKHLWGHYCRHCYRQALYSDLDLMCELGIPSGIEHECGPLCGEAK
jgi:hypothetical protein